MWNLCNKDFVLSVLPASLSSWRQDRNREVSQMTPSGVTMGVCVGGVWSVVIKRNGCIKKKKLRQAVWNQQTLQRTVEICAGKWFLSLSANIHNLGACVQRWGPGSWELSLSIQFTLVITKNS